MNTINYMDAICERCGYELKFHIDNPRDSRAYCPTTEHCGMVFKSKQMPSKEELKLAMVGHVSPEPPQRTYTEEELVDAVEDGMEFGHNSGLLELANLKSKLAEANTLIDQMGDALQDLMDATPKQTLDKDWWNDNLIHAFEKSKTMIDKALEFLKY